MRSLSLSLALAILMAPAATAFDQSYTVDEAGADEFAINQGGIRINNLSLTEKPALFKKGLFNFEVSLSARNTGAEPKNLTVMLAGKGPKGKILWAVTVAPPFYTVAKGTTATMKGSAYVTEGTLAKTKKVWLRVVGNF